MTILPFPDLLKIQEKAVQIGLHNRRPAMLVSLPPGFVGSFQDAGAPVPQLAIDLNEMNKDMNLVIADGVMPLFNWLSTAAAFSSQYPEIQAFFSRKANEVADKASAGGKTPAGSSGSTVDAQNLPERLISGSPLLPAGFLDAAQAAARGVVRLVVPIYSGTAPALLGSGKPREGYGTGWLIGPKHLLTNNHVVLARLPGETAPSNAEVDLQGAHAVAEFDYLSDVIPPVKVDVLGIVARDSNLDFALLELTTPVTDRPPLQLAATPLAVETADPANVNIVQHPRGAPKQLALRNNVVAALVGNDLAYYTDTDNGSSGSPVCNDQWQVVALHKGSTQRLGRFSFQGKTTAWVNIGTPIHMVVDHLKAKLGEAGWAAVGARLG